MQTRHRNDKRGGRDLLAACVGVAVGWAGAAGAAVLGTETFGSLSGWQDRDAGEMAVSFNAGFGNSAGSLQGSFLAQEEASPDTDALRATAASSSGGFTGDYWTDVPGFASWSFSFYADDVLPSDLLIRFSDGVNTFVRSTLSQVVAQDAWHTVTVPLTYAGWLGGSASAFSNALSNVTYIDVQLTRNGTAAQDYFVDNFALNGGSGGGASVPEPSTAGLLLASVAVLRAARKRGSRARQALSALWQQGGTEAPSAARSSSARHGRGRVDEPVLEASPRRQRRRRRKQVQLIY